MTLNVSVSNYRFARSSVCQVALVDCFDSVASILYPNVPISLTGIVQTVGVPSTFSGVSITQFQQQVLAGIRPRLIGGNNGFS